MDKLIKVNKMAAISLAKYRLNEFSTEHGTIIFDNSKGGKIDNSLIYHIGHLKFGYIDIYIDKDYKVINSIWFVELKSEILYEDEHLAFPDYENYEIPLFETGIWETRSKDMWPKVANVNAIEVYHNGVDCVYITFGNKQSLCPLNKHILLQFDEDNALTGILIKEEKEVAKLIKLLKGK